MNKNNSSVNAIYLILLMTIILCFLCACGKTGNQSETNSFSISPEFSTEKAPEDENKTLKKSDEEQLDLSTEYSIEINFSNDENIVFDNGELVITFEGILEEGTSRLIGLTFDNTTGKDLYITMSKIKFDRTAMSVANTSVELLDDTYYAVGPHYNFVIDREQISDITTINNISFELEINANGWYDESYATLDVSIITDISLTEAATTSSQSEQMDAESVVALIHTYDNNGTNEMISLLQEYRDILSEEQIIDCLLWCVRYQSYTEASNDIKSRLKSPRSFYLYDANISSAIVLEDVYRTKVEIEYDVTNSFGAEITDTDSYLCYFTIDVDDLAIEFTEI